MANTESLSAERLAEIRGQLNGVISVPPDTTEAVRVWHEATFLFAQYADDLLVEVERLRAREAALLEVVRVVAEGQPVSIDEDLWGIHLVSLRQSDVERFHQQARALLASDSADEAK